MKNCVNRNLKQNVMEIFKQLKLSRSIYLDNSRLLILLGIVCMKVCEVT
jgi:hypothetical protein